MFVFSVENLLKNRPFSDNAHVMIWVSGLDSTRLGIWRRLMSWSKSGSLGVGGRKGSDGPTQQQSRLSLFPKSVVTTLTTVLFSEQHSKLDDDCVKWECAYRAPHSASHRHWQSSREPIENNAWACILQKLDKTHRRYELKMHPVALSVYS